MVARTALTLTALALLSPTLARGADDDSAKRDRRARAALALAGTPSASVASAPAPRPVTPKLNYADGHKAATLDQTPLVIYVGMDGPKPANAICSKADALGDVIGPAVVIAYPIGDRLYIDAAIPAKDATPEAVQRAVDAAAKKLDLPARKDMPAAPRPLDWQLRNNPGAMGAVLMVAMVADLPAKAACVCGDSCECRAKGRACPTQCPVSKSPPGWVCDGERCRPAAKGGTAVADGLPAGFAWVRTDAGHGLRRPDGTWHVPPSALCTERLDAGYSYTPLEGIPRGVWVSPCVKDGDCRVLRCDTPAIGQHGEPTNNRAASLNTFDPRDYPNGMRSTCPPGGCVIDREERVVPVQVPFAGPLATRPAASSPSGFGAAPAGLEWHRDPRGPGGWGLRQTGATAGGLKLDTSPRTFPLVVPPELRAVPSAAPTQAAPFRLGSPAGPLGSSCPNGRCPNQR